MKTKTMKTKKDIFYCTDCFDEIKGHIHWVPFDSMAAGGVQPFCRDCAIEKLKEMREEE